MFENWNQIDLLYFHIEKLQRVMTLTTSISGNSHQVFLNQQNALGLHKGRAGGLLCVHLSAKMVVRVTESSYCTKEVPVRMSSDISSKRMRYMDPISKLLYRNILKTNLNPSYTNALH